MAGWLTPRKRAATGTSRASACSTLGRKSATYPERPASLNGEPKPWRALARDQSGNKREVRPPPGVSSKAVGHRPILRAELCHGPRVQWNSPR
jgi:hypothetical protein